MSDFRYVSCERQPPKELSEREPLWRVLWDHVDRGPIDIYEVPAIVVMVVCLLALAWTWVA